MGITLNTFKSIKKEKIQVLYPCISLDYIKNAKTPGFLAESKYFFSLNRYERKKNIKIAIQSYALLKQKSVKLLIGGGFDPFLLENIQHFSELTKLCNDLSLN